MAHPRTGIATGLTLIPFIILAAVTGPGGDSLMAATDLKPGDAAPAFSLPGSDGRTHTLAEHRGKRVVVLAWFPKAFTGG